MCKMSDKTEERTGQYQFTEVGKSSLGNLGAYCDPGWNCCIQYKEGFNIPTGRTMEGCKLQAALLFLEYN